MTHSNDTFRFTCPACLETSEMSREHEERIMPCPSCGVSAAISDDEKIPPPPVASQKVEPQTPTNDELAYMARLQIEAEFQREDGFKRVAYRVFRRQSLETWEALFDRTSQFASSLPPGALINISHSGGRGTGTDAAAVWYWEFAPIDKMRIREFQKTESPQA